MPNYGALAGAVGAVNAGISEGFNIYQGLKAGRLAEQENARKQAEFEAEAPQRLFKANTAAAANLLQDKWNKVHEEESKYRQLYGPQIEHAEKMGDLHQLYQQRDPDFLEILKGSGVGDEVDYQQYIDESGQPQVGVKIVNQLTGPSGIVLKQEDVDIYVKSALQAKELIDRRLSKFTNQKDELQRQIADLSGAGARSAERSKEYGLDLEKQKLALAKWTAEYEQKERKNKALESGREQSAIAKQKEADEKRFYAAESKMSTQEDPEKFGQFGIQAARLALKNGDDENYAGIAYTFIDKLNKSKPTKIRGITIPWTGDTKYDDQAKAVLGLSIGKPLTDDELKTITNYVDENPTTDLTPDNIRAILGVESKGLTAPSTATNIVLIDGVEYEGTPEMIASAKKQGLSVVEK